MLKDKNDERAIKGAKTEEKIITRKRPIPSAEKIQIFERFAKTGDALSGNTVFEGHPIGYWAIQIRSHIKRQKEGEKEEFSEEQIERLKKIGVLEKQIDSTLDEKIDFLVEWTKKYPKAKIIPKLPNEILKEYAGTKEEYKNLIEEYEKTQKYYRYISRRKWEDKLKESQFIKCKEGNVGGIFGYPTIIEKQAELYDIKESEIEYIFSNYGTMENFYKLYRNGKLNNEQDMILASSIIKDVIDIDKANKDGSDKLVKELIGKDNKLIVYSSEKLMELINGLNVSDKNKEILKKKYGLTESKELEKGKKLAKEYNVSTKRIYEILQRCKRELKDASIEKEINIMDKIEKLKHNKSLTNEKIKELDKIEKDLNDISSSKIKISSNEAKERLNFIKDMEIKEKNKENEKKENARKEGLISIEDLGFSTMTSNALNRAGIHTVKDICNLTEREMNEIRGLGKNRN